ncbi:MAG: serine/threonine-protein phosphatase [Planctomycetes bacterium]|nr:serine/threonine-protein phosphatase [Planctomycetota bacterium]
MNQIASHIDVGPRDNLEDAAMGLSILPSAVNTGPAYVLALFDGRGPQFGEVASSEALVHIPANLLAILAAHAAQPFKAQPSNELIAAALGQILESANQAILNRAMEDPALLGMATTAVCGVVMDDTLIIGWVGDSRCYIHNKNGLRQVNHDHSRIQELIDVGQIERSDAGNHPEAHAITRYLGQAAGFTPETAVTQLEAGDVVLLCTDGLTDVLSDEEIAEVIASCRVGRFPFSELPEKLVRQALDAGTCDNTTALCYHHGSVHIRVNCDRTRTAAYVEAVAHTMSPNKRGALS